MTRSYGEIFYTVAFATHTVGLAGAGFPEKRDAHVKYQGERTG